jgi:hypothetical protein
MGPQFVGPSASACLSLDVTRSLETHMHPNCRLQVPGTRSRSISAVLTVHSPRSSRIRPLFRTSVPVAQRRLCNSPQHAFCQSFLIRIPNSAITYAILPREHNTSDLISRSFSLPTIPPPSRIEARNGHGVICAIGSRAGMR